jgi:hypothetical protein
LHSAPEKSPQSGEQRPSSPRLSLILDRGLESARDLSCDRSQIDRFEPDGARTRFDLGDAQQCVESVEDAVHIADRQIDGALLVADRCCVGSNRFEPPQVSPQRLAQVVSDVAADVSVGLDERFDPIEHAIEGSRQSPWLVLDICRGDSLA